MRELLASDSTDMLVAALEKELIKDKRVKVAGVDIDGILRGKVMSKEKFMSCIKAEGFGNYRCHLCYSLLIY
jgi:glutamine synthetase